SGSIIVCASFTGPSVCPQMHASACRSVSNYMTAAWSCGRTASFCGTIDCMKVLAFVALAALAAAPARAGQPPADPTGQAYAQFLLGHYLEEADDVNGAIAAYKRAMELDPRSAEIAAELAGLYMRQNRAQDALSTAEHALTLD